MDSTKRFSDRVGDYVKYRPHYPAALIPALESANILDAFTVVADIGSGTGISTEPFLRKGNRVFAVEPNEAMRKKAEELMSHYPGFLSMDGTAEATGLPDTSIDLILAGQAFHWFDPVAARKEFVRISRPGASVALVWNERLILTEFEREYEDLILRAGGDYKTINHTNLTDREIGTFFKPEKFVLRCFENEQLFDLEGLKGRLLSSSYIPKEGPGFDQMMQKLEDIFARHVSDGQVRVGYETKLYTGVLLLSLNER